MKMKWAMMGRNNAMACVSDGNRLAIINNCGEWSIAGDENSKYYHGLLNKSRNQLSIRGVLSDGAWVESPAVVKNEFLTHFRDRFERPKASRLVLDTDFPLKLDSDQKEDLERMVSKEEIKSAVWDCGVDKSPGPDGFTFGFYRRYWSMLESDVVDAVSYFFNHGKFPKGGNSSFIALIPKLQDAKLVKDFRPISLIGSLYKIIAKVLSNRLVGVLGGLVNEVQSAFVSDRQILDGPFILNDLIHWCKSKKKQTLIFKVDFEKAFDSVRWDYLDDVLNLFGFGAKWRSWIQNCLHSSRGSVLVNGSPTSEFQFHKGLKQGDPLSPFLFILIMESLHLSFQRVVNDGLFKGVNIGSSLQLSHLFYADDVIFMGQWSEANIDIIVNALKCFHLASGLRMNLHKSKLMGIAIENDKIARAANKIGCLTLKSPFSYLGIKVGGLMSRVNSWDKVVDSLYARLSKWKMKTLSIGGRLTLLKSVLGSMPIYYMSLFKVPSQVLKKMEAIRSHFFNGAEAHENKMCWVKWNRVLASKEKGGLGVSSYFALNRALMIKWTWRFRNDGNSLWSKFIRAMYGSDGKLRKHVNRSHPSIWLDIVNEVHNLKNKNLDILSLMKKKIGNGSDTSFWEETWRGDHSFSTSFPRIFALEDDKSITVARKMAHDDLTFSLRRNPRDGAEAMQFSELKAILDGLLLSSAKDRWSWSIDGSEEFSVASTRRLLDDHLLQGTSVKTRWVKEVPIKINIMAWKVRFDYLPSRFNLSKRGLDILDICCPTCTHEAETTNHIFFSCTMVREIYLKIAHWWDVRYSNFSSYEDWYDWLWPVYT
ncbi:RNA-directed DNA polymerase, eukaryota [Tanacetum coccineum]